MRNSSTHSSTLGTMLFAGNCQYFTLTIAKFQRLLLLGWYRNNLIKTVHLEIISFLIDYEMKLVLSLVCFLLGAFIAPFEEFVLQVCLCMFKLLQGNEMESLYSWEAHSSLLGLVKFGRSSAICSALGQVGNGAGWNHYSVVFART